MSDNRELLPFFDAITCQWSFPVVDKAVANDKEMKGADLIVDRGMTWDGSAWRAATEEELRRAAEHCAFVTQRTLPLTFRTSEILEPTVEHLIPGESVTIGTFTLSQEVGSDDEFGRLFGPNPELEPQLTVEPESANPIVIAGSRVLSTFPRKLAVKLLEADDALEQAPEATELFDKAKRHRAACEAEILSYVRAHYRG